MSLLRNFDFTPSMYLALLEALKAAGYSFQTFEEFCSSPEGKCIILRHDVDRRPRNAMMFSEIENRLGIKGSYHFRIVGSSNEPDIIREIVTLGHEIGYHYEDMTLAAALKGKSGAVSSDSLAKEAFDRFRSNLTYFRQFYPVRVISMHGSPTGRIDNRLVWKFYDYRECGIICEPYFDIDFSEMLYLTDTGRRWDGEKYSVRDKAIAAESLKPGGSFAGWKVRPVRGSLLTMTDEGLALRERFGIHSSKGIIELANAGNLPVRMVMNTHPQRWNNAYLPWVWELGAQTVKNQLKKLVIRFRGLKTIN